MSAPAMPASAVSVPSQPVDPTSPALSVRFLLDVDATPGMLPRLLQPYAKRDLVPDRMWSHRNGDVMHVEIAVEAMPAEVVHLIEGNLRQVVGVRSVSRVVRAAMLRVA